MDPESDKCVEISTASSVQEMIAPGCYAILFPIFVGFTCGPECLMGEEAVNTPFLFFAGEISYLCFTGSQKYF